MSPVSPRIPFHSLNGGRKRLGQAHEPLLWKRDLLGTFAGERLGRVRHPNSRQGALPHLRSKKLEKEGLDTAFLSRNWSDGLNQCSTKRTPQSCPTKALSFHARSGPSPRAEFYFYQTLREPLEPRQAPLPRCDASTGPQPGGSK